MSFQDQAGAPDTPEIFSQPDDLGRIKDTDLNTSLGEQLGAHAGGAFMGGLRTLYGIGEKRLAGAPAVQDTDPYLLRMFGGVGHPVQRPPEVSREDAMSQVKQEGLEGRITLPADQATIRKPVLDLMMNDAHEDAAREAAVSRGPQGFWPSALGFMTEVGVGMLDPVNAAAFSIPVIGEARYGAILARAGESYLARAGVATAKGAAQGAVGGAAMVPLDWWGHTLDGQDYTMADALRSVALSAGMGAAAHGMGSVFGDVRARMAERPLPGSPEDLALRALGKTTLPRPGVAASPASPAIDLDEVPGIGGPPHPAETLADLPEAARGDLTHAAVADVVNGVPVRAAEMLETAAQQDPRIAETVMGPPRIQTGQPHVDAILRDPDTAVAIAEPKVNRTQDVPYTAGPDNEGNGLNIDRHFPESFTIDGKTFDPAEPFAVHEFSERDAINKLTAAGMDEATAYKVAHWDVAEVAEGHWYADHGIDQEKAEAAYQPYIDKIEHEKLAKGDGDVPANLFKKPYPHDNVNTAAKESAPVPKPTAEESARGREILARTERVVAPGDRAAATEEAQRQTIAQRVRADLIAAGRSEEEATHLANIEAANIVTTARQFEGRAGTPLEVYEREHVGFREMEAPTAEAGDGHFQRGAAPPFYSAVERAVTSAKQDKASPEQWLGMLKNMPGVKAEELDKLEFEDWLKEQKGSVTKAQVADYVRANRIEVREVTKGQGSTKFSGYTLPGGENYRELLLMLPPKETPAARNREERFVENYHVPASHRYGDEASDANRLAHIFMDDRVIDGKRTLLLKEVQSDWHQVGRKYGYRQSEPLTTRKMEDNRFGEGVHEAIDSRGVVVGRGFSPEEAIEAAKRMPSVPDAPFKTTWPELVMKRMIRYAAENGYDKLAWVTGEERAAAYDLSNHVSHIDVRHPTPKAMSDAAKHVTINGKTGIVGSGQIDKSGKILQGYDALGGGEGKYLSEYVGKDVADKILQSSGEHRLSGLDLKIGGEGMRGFYDQILPATVNKLTKKFGGKVGRSDLTYAEAETNKDVLFDVRNAAGDIVHRGIYDENEAARLAKEAGGSYDMETVSKTESVHTLDITPQLRTAAVEQGFPLFQEGRAGEPLGRITFADGQRIIDFFKNADASTGLHELGHMWLERFMRYSAREDAPESMRADRAAILRELGADHPDNITDEQHEQFARWVEQYARTGDAPSARLAGAFAKFREWLVAIYRTMRRLGSPISDEMRGVMDRLLASPEETAEYRGRGDEAAGTRLAQGEDAGDQERPPGGFDRSAPTRNWEDLAKRPDPDPDLTEASRAADHAPEPASTDPAKAPSAAEKMAAEVEKSWRDMEAGYSEEERALVNDALQKLDDDNAGRLQMIKEAAACLMAAGV